MLSHLLLAALTFSTPVAAAAPFTVLPEKAGHSFADQGVRWWLWALTAEEGHDPIDDLTGARCGNEQPEDAWYLAGTYQNGTPVHRACSIPVNRPVFFPVANIYSAGRTKAQCEQGLPQAVNFKLSGGQVMLDGAPLNGVTRGRTPCAFIEDVDVWLGVDGYWMSLKFTAPGKHLLAWKGTAGNFAQNITYTLTVR